MGDYTESSSILTTSVISMNAMGNFSPTPNLTHHLPVILTSTKFLLCKTQFLPMICDCGLSHYIDGSELVPPHTLDNDKPNPAYTV